MRDYKSLTHTHWNCKYHVVFIPKKKTQRYLWPGKKIFRLKWPSLSAAWVPSRS